MKGLDRSQMVFLENFFEGTRGCSGEPRRWADEKDWRPLVQRGLLELFPCPSGARHSHFRLTALGREVYALQKLAGDVPPK